MLGTWKLEIVAWGDRTKFVILRGQTKVGNIHGLFRKYPTMEMKNRDIYEEGIRGCA